MEITPIEIFRKWFNVELNLTKVSVPTACCLSTIGTDHYPNARFVSLKAITENSFIVTGTLTSRKGIEINKNNKVALTFWWTETERQVRIQGNAIMLKAEHADKYFSERCRDSQIVSIVSNQGQKIINIEELNKRYREIDTAFSNKILTRPENWSGWAVEPVRIEFLEFMSNRFHDRKLFELKNGQWIQTQLQP